MHPIFIAGLAHVGNTASSQQVELAFGIITWDKLNIVNSNFRVIQTA